MNNKEKPSILLIYTGGTIGMMSNAETGALENFNFEHLLRYVPEIKQFNLNISHQPRFYLLQFFVPA